MTDLTGKHVVITGAGGALGSVLAERALELGARLTLVDLAAPKGRFVPQWIAVDLTSEEASRTALSSLGPVDALFHVAGGFDMGPAVHETSSALLSKMIAINVTTLHNTVRAIVPGMQSRGSGAIVTVGALSALKGQANSGAYCAAKSMVMRLTESMSGELKDAGINVNCVLPSLIDTPANRRDMPQADFSRWVSPRALADVICFLGSPAASAIHGALVPVAGRV